MSTSFKKTELMLGPSELYLCGTTPTPEGQAIEPRTDRSVLENGKVLTGHNDTRLAHAWALRSYGAGEPFSIGKMTFGNGQENTYMIVSDADTFLRSLYRDSEGNLGGFIHKVDASGFQPTPDRIGQIKLLSQQPAPVIAPPSFVSLQEVMEQGVQVYAVMDKRFAQTLGEGRKQHPVIIQEGLETGALHCLNEDYGFSRLEIKVPDGERAALDLQRREATQAKMLKLIGDATADKAGRQPAAQVSSNQSRITP